MNRRIETFRPRKSNYFTTKYKYKQFQIFPSFCVIITLDVICWGLPMTRLRVYFLPRIFSFYRFRRWNWVHTKYKITVVWSLKLCHRSAVFDVIIIISAESVETKWRNNPTKAAMLTFSRDKWIDSRIISELTSSQNMLCTNNCILFDK